METIVSRVDRQMLLVILTIDFKVIACHIVVMELLHMLPYNNWSRSPDSYICPQLF